MKVFVDFDDVLFCSKFFVRDFFKIFKKNKISKEIFSGSYYSENGKIKGSKQYHLGKQLKRLEKLGFNAKTIEKEVDDFLKKCPRYVFNDVECFLGSFKKNELYLISYARTKFQREKIIKSGISKFFKKIIITDCKKSEEINKNSGKEEEVFFIDDRIEQIDEVKKTIPRIKTIFLKRKKGRYQDKKSKFCDFEVENLREAIKIIKRKKWETEKEK